ncbi:hypothetical protein DSO57_1004934 [Entomophthora muscae]|uniref:Uncharacterized protein n=1 Tax=Entomophthora muscae TaxID=34485 RepID=A0ACC2T7R1_9FUNG|nr:hypothetical protein DSO57_1004934 [Entomophthora muscae]
MAQVDNHSAWTGRLLYSVKKDAELWKLSSQLPSQTTHPRSPLPQHPKATSFSSQRCDPAQLGGVREGARLTKSGSHPSGTNHQDAIQCKTGIATQRGLPKETGCERGGKYTSKAMTKAPVSNHREQSQVEGASASNSGIWCKGKVFQVRRRSFSSNRF